VPDRFLPDKAIDLIDEAAARLRMYKSPEAAQVRRAEQELRQIEDDLRLLEEEGESEDEMERLRRQRETVEEQLSAYKANWNEETNQPRLGSEDIAEVVAMWTGIPTMRIAGEESARLIQMESALHNRIVGQHEAIEAIARAVLRARAGMKDPRRPIGSFMFLGPTGVGKTE